MCLPAVAAPLQEKHALLQKLQPALASGLHPHDFIAELYSSGELAPRDTLCTTCAAGGRAEDRLGRPALVVSSTSWTPDEDFGILLKAAEVSSLAGNALVACIWLACTPQAVARACQGSAAVLHPQRASTGAALPRPARP